MHKQSSIIIGTILIVVGVLFLLAQLFPGIAPNFDMSQQWPLIVVAVGVLLLLSALFGTPELAIPGSIVTGIGSILYVQNLTNAWSSWSYVWALIPGFVGIGLLVAGTLGHERRRSWREGSRLILISSVLFIIFGAFFTGFGDIGRYWPLLLIGLGLWQLLPRRATKKSDLKPFE
ncbi:LiaI-LiaF-like domain-containing protein [Candidatus Leptofilum sp.]|uniref:LiaI-LiaF-like domain-containing protein n=1 Tax=Candidatus Leptofilum sp. TaxID=3241576 RepID=UPI003B5A0D6C